MIYPNTGEVHPVREDHRGWQGRAAQPEAAGGNGRAGRRCGLHQRAENDTEGN